MRYKVTTISSNLVVTLADAKLWLKIDSDTTEDALITSLIHSAVNDFESYCNRAVRSQTVEMKFNDFSETIELMRSPVASITSITYKDSDGASQTLSSSVYELDSWALPNRVVLKWGQSYPAGTDVKVTYTAGYSEVASIPDGIKTVIKVMIRDYYKNRDNPNRRWTTMVERMMEHYRIVGYMK